MPEQPWTRITLSYAGNTISGVSQASLSYAIGIYIQGGEGFLADADFEAPVFALFEPGS